MPFDSICIEILKWFKIYSTASQNVLGFFVTVLMKVNWHSSLSLTETCPPPLVSSARTSSNTRVTSEKYLLFQSLCKVFLQQRNLHLVVHLLLQFENGSKKRAAVVVAALLASVVGSVLHKQCNLKKHVGPAFLLPFLSSTKSSSEQTIPPCQLCRSRTSPSSSEG